MNLELLTPVAVRLVLRLASAPGLSLRALITDEKGHPSPSTARRLEELADAGLLRRDAGEYRGRPTTVWSLTDRGQVLAQLLRTIERV